MSEEKPMRASAGVEARPGGVRLRLYVSPRASRTKVAGLHDDRVKLLVAAPPVDGKANVEIVRFLARTLGVSKRDVHWVSGESGKRKTLEVEGVSVEQARTALRLD